MRCVNAVPVCMAAVISLSAETEVPLRLDTDTPLPLYLNRRVRIRAGEPVHATFVRPLYAADSMVICTSTEGHIVRLQRLFEKSVTIMNSEVPVKLDDGKSSKTSLSDRYQ